VPGTATKVNPPLVDGGSVSNGYAFSPDGLTIGYVADQDTLGTRELYTVPVAQPGVATKVNGPLTANGNVCRFRFSPDSQRIAYCADQDTDDVLELYLVDLGAPGVAMKLNAPLPDGGAVSTAYDFGPDGDFVVFLAEQDEDGDQELYRVDVATPGIVARLMGSLTDGGNVVRFMISPDGTRVGYVADQDTDGTFELNEANAAEADAAVKLSPAQASEGVWDL